MNSSTAQTHFSTSCQTTTLILCKCRAVASHSHRHLNRSMSRLLPAKTRMHMSVFHSFVSVLFNYTSTQLFLTLMHPNDSFWEKKTQNQTPLTKRRTLEEVRRLLVIKQLFHATDLCFKTIILQASLVLLKRLLPTRAFIYISAWSYAASETLN